MLILGGPGSGKTTIALLKARRHVIEYLKPEQSILFLSFSNSAIRRILESAGNILVNDIAKRVDIKTYHSFAWDILRSHGYLTSTKRRLTIVPSQDADIRKAGLTDDKWAEEQMQLYAQSGLVTYDQFAPQAAELLERSQTARACFNDAYPLILVDEFQDTDDDQWRMIHALSQGSKIIALGDTEQRIYAWRPGVSTERLDEFGQTLAATTFDFENENNRSPATGIAGFARSLLSPGSQQDLPDDVDFKRMQPGQFNTAIKFNLIRTWHAVVKRAGHRDVSIAIAGRNKQIVRMISDALASTNTIRGKTYGPISHDVMFDQTQIVLAARVIAHMMDTAHSRPNERLAGALDRLADMHRAVGNKTNITASERLRKWADKCRENKAPKTKCVTELAAIIEKINDAGFKGSPTEDWLLVRGFLQKATASELTKTAENARFLRLLRRGSLIEDDLANLWKTHGAYIDAEEAFEKAILQDQLLDGHRPVSQVSVMNMHQLKGREYDGVLLVEDQHRTFRGRESDAPFMETRRLLQVSLTRARHYAIILSDKKNATLDVIFED